MMSYSPRILSAYEKKVSLYEILSEKNRVTRTLAIPTADQIPESF